MMVMKNCLVDVKSKCPQEWQSINEFLMDEVDIIDENDTLVSATSYFIVDHELE
jgi:hypothetical protein